MGTERECRAGEFRYQRGNMCWCRKTGQRNFVTNEVTGAGAGRQGSGFVIGTFLAEVQDYLFINKQSNILKVSFW